MKKIRPLSLILYFLSVFVGAVRADETVGYRIAGDYLEACACGLVCPCHLGEDAAAMRGCQATYAWHIEKGSYGDVSLDGLTMIGMILRPEKNTSAALGKMEWGLYLDENADVKQRVALEAVFRANAGAQCGTLHGPKFVPIAFAKKATDADGLADEYLLEIKNTLSLKTAMFKNEEGKANCPRELPRCVRSRPLLREGRAAHLPRQGLEDLLGFRGSTGLYGRFDYAK